MSREVGLLLIRSDIIGNEVSENRNSAVHSTTYDPTFIEK